MVGLGKTFDANAKENNPSNCVPEGVYTLCLVSAEEKYCKDNSKGSYLQCEFEILDGKFKGRKVFDLLGINLASEKAAEIARGKLSSICRACNKPTVDDTDELVGIPFQCVVKVEKDDSYGDKNRLGRVVESKGKPAATRPAPTPAAATNRKPVHQTIEDDEIPF